MTEAEFLRQYAIIRDDICGAINVFHAYNAINAFAAEGDNGQAMQEHADFWMIQTYSLQATFFVLLGRIFDNNRNSHSVDKLLAATVDHPEFFSRAALSLRDEAQRRTRPAEWVKQMMEPSGPDLKPLQNAVLPHAKKYREVYKPIRNKEFAHKENMDREVKANLFTRARTNDVGEILRFLSDLKDVLFELIENGRRPVICEGKLQPGHSHYVHDCEEVERNTRAVLSALYSPRDTNNDR